MKVNRDLDIGMQAFVDRAGHSCLLQGALFGMSRREWNRDIDSQSLDSSYRLLKHLLPNTDLSPAQINLRAFAKDPHDRDHASPKGGGYKISWRKSGAFPAII